MLTLAAFFTFLYIMATTATKNKTFKKKKKSIEILFFLLNQLVQKPKNKEPYALKTYQISTKLGDSADKSFFFTY